MPVAPHELAQERETLTLSSVLLSIKPKIADTLKHCRALLAGAVLAVAPAEAGELEKPLPITSNIGIDSPGSLVIGGGGDLPDEAHDAFIRLAGGKGARIVIIPTASARADILSHRLVHEFSNENVESIEFLHTRDRDEANSPDFVKPLDDATGVWMWGGKQPDLAGPYNKTLVEDRVLQILDRGGVVGGTSAGASIMSQTMIVGGNPEVRVGEGFDIFKHTFIDQHFDTCKREPRMRWLIKQYPGHTGLGIDEDTAVVIEKNVLSVVGKARARIFISAALEDTHILQAGQRIDLRGPKQVAQTGEE